MKGLVKLLMLIVVVLFVSSLFKGGDYLRTLGNLTGIKLRYVADMADKIRIERIIAEKKQEQTEKGKGIVGN